MPDKSAPAWHPVGSLQAQRAPTTPAALDETRPAAINNPKPFTWTTEPDINHHTGFVLPSRAVSRRGRAGRQSAVGRRAPHVVEWGLAAAGPSSAAASVAASAGFPAGASVADPGRLGSYQGQHFQPARGCGLLCLARRNGFRVAPRDVLVLPGFV